MPCLVSLVQAAYRGTQDAKAHDPLNLYKHKPLKMEKMYPTPSERGDGKMEQASTGHPAHLRAGWSPCFFFLSKQLGLWC